MMGTYRMEENYFIHAEIGVLECVFFLTGFNTQHLISEALVVVRSMCQCEKSDISITYITVFCKEACIYFIQFGRPFRRLEIRT